MSHVLWFVLPALVAAALASVLTPLAARLAVGIGALDMPGERKIHTTPIPRLGGIAVVGAIAVTLALARVLSHGQWQLPPHLSLGMTAGLLPILIVSFVDDVRGVPARTKFAIHFLGASVAVALGICLGPTVHIFGAALHIGWLATPLSVLWIVGVTNAFNIIDGLDGLSTGLALISAICMSAVFALVGQSAMAGVSLVLGGALAGFLPYNIHPAKLFLGDTGATAIGFCLAAFALSGGSTLSSGFAALLPVFVLGLPIADTLVALVRRLLRRFEHHRGGVFEADRNHIHHRLLALGIEHATAVLILYGAGLLLAGTALLSVLVTTRQAAMMLVALLLAGSVGIQRLGYDEFAFIRRGMVMRVYELPAVKRGFFVVFVDIALAFVAAYLSVGLKTDAWEIAHVHGVVLNLATTLAPVTVLVFVWRGMYKGSWRVAGLYDLTKAAVAVFIAMPVGALALRTFGTPYPLSLFAIDGLITLLLTVSLRASYVLLENSRLRSSHQGVPILIYGAGRRGVAALHELFQNHAAGLRPIGFVDDDPEKHGRILSGVPVLGAVKALERILKESGAQGVLISTPSLAEERVERCVATCRALSIGIFRLDVQVRHLDGSNYVGVPPVLVQVEEITHEERELQIDLKLGRQRCPSCNQPAAYRSKARNVFERFRKVRTNKRLYRCEECGWRGWVVPLEFVPQGVVPGPDLESFATFRDEPPAESRASAAVSLEALNIP
jgi:UDP-GlcNAc:undecaprenyl-phosphate GlcNAc-1-phosphate transferase